MFWPLIVVTFTVNVIGIGDWVILKGKNWWSGFWWYKIYITTDLRFGAVNTGPFCFEISIQASRNRRETCPVGRSWSTSCTYEYVLSRSEWLVAYGTSGSVISRGVSHWHCSCVSVELRHPNSGTLARNDTKHSGSITFDRIGWLIHGISWRLQFQLQLQRKNSPNSWAWSIAGNKTIVRLDMVMC